MIRFGDCVINKQAMTITIGSRIRKFNKQAEGNKIFEIVCFLLLGGWTKRQALFDFLYAGDREGGPLAGIHIFDQWFYRERSQLERLGLKIIQENRGGNVWYKITSVIES